MFENDVCQLTCTFVSGKPSSTRTHTRLITHNHTEHLSTQPHIALNFFFFCNILQFKINKTAPVRIVFALQRPQSGLDGAPRSISNRPDPSPSVSTFVRFIVKIHRVICTIKPAELTNNHWLPVGIEISIAVLTFKTK